MPKLQHLGLLTDWDREPSWSVAMKNSSMVAVAIKDTWNNMKISASVSSMLSSTLNPSELKKYKVLNKFEKLKELTIFAFMWGMVRRATILKPKEIQKALFLKLKIFQRVTFALSYRDQLFLNPPQCFKKMFCQI